MKEPVWRDQHISVFDDIIIRGATSFSTEFISIVRTEHYPRTPGLLKAGIVFSVLATPVCFVSIYAGLFGFCLASF